MDYLAGNVQLVIAIFGSPNKRAILYFLQKNPTERYIIIEFNRIVVSLFS